MNTTTKPPRRGAAIALLTFVLALTACSSGSSSGSADDVTLTLVTHDSFAVSEEVLDEFTEETGISVETLMAGDAGSALNQAILTKGDPLGDVFFGVDNTFLTRALDEDLFVSYESTELEHVSDDLVVDDEHRVTPVDLGDVCINYDKAAFEQFDFPAPHNLEALADPMYAGKLVVENPATSSPGLAFMLATIEEFGEDGWLDYWKTLRDNDVEVTDGWEDAYYGGFSAASDTGDRPLVVSYASSPAAEIFLSEGALEEAPTGVVAGSCFRQIEFAGILAGTGHPDEAGELIDFMLSKPFQEDIPLSMFVFPIRDDAELPPVFADNAELPTDAFEIPANEIGAHRDEWIQAWTDTVLR